MIGDKRNLRLYIVGLGFTLVTLGLWGRLVQVQVFSRAHYDSLAIDQWYVRRPVPPVRGSIFDRNGQPLAMSIQSFSVAVQPKQVTEREKVASALGQCLSMQKKIIRDKLRSDEPFVYVTRRCQLTKEARAKLMTLRGVVVERQADRVYPYGTTGAQLVGFVGIDGEGMAGIEAALDGELRGVAGWEQVQRDGRYRSFGLQTYAEKKPVDGKQVFLTIDARLQEIAETELERGVRDAEAKRGAVVIMDVKTGEILALGEWPSPASRGRGSLSDSLWTLRSVSCVYEPGSTFKLVTAAALLEKGKVSSSDVFDGEGGRADMGVAEIRDAHPFGRLTFREAFVQSSNVVIAKAALRLDPREFVEFVSLFGFGSPTGIELLGESPGHFTAYGSRRWSKRSQLTMAFGQEVAVTPLQIANAFAAVANGGVLSMPRIVRTVVDGTTGQNEKTKPVELRRIMSEKVARQLSEYCRGVVEEGTGVAAKLECLDVAGKTGTGQKSAPRGGYLPGKFVASFAGFAPASDPKMVCLVMLDEPNWANRFGGISAAPVFARIMEAIAGSSSMFDDVVRKTEAEDMEARKQRFVTPNFLRMTKDVVMERARMFDLNLLCKGDGGEVIAQDPDPGVAIDKDEVVRVYLSRSSAKSNGREVPDLKGLAVRAARRSAAEAGFKCEVGGSGIVVTQWPAPGVVSRGGVVRIQCGNAANVRKTG